LRNFGYVTLEPAYDSLLFRKGQTVPAHEFHYWQCSQPGDAFNAVKRDGRCWVTGHASPTIYAGFPHLYFWADPEIPKRFVQKCASIKC
ncbi:MAG: cobyrinate a,c-diamide synthase, partial [Ruminococcus sp.]|nr:cobyrinate a,c-diamide synthase [Ruminococcus sp.]